MLLVLLVAGMGGAALWATGRGFDVTDEGFYLACYDHPAQSLSGFTQFQWMLGGTEQARERTVPEWRGLGLALSLIGALALALGVRDWSLRAARDVGEATGGTPLIALAVIGALSGHYSWPGTPSYNTVLSASGFAAAGLAFVAAAPGRSRAGALALSAGAGALVAVAVLAKLPGGAAVAILLAVLTAVGEGGLAAAAALLGAAAVTGLTILQLTVGVAAWWDELRFAIATVSASSHSGQGGRLFKGAANVLFWDVLPFTPMLAAVRGLVRAEPGRRTLWIAGAALALGAAAGLTGERFGLEAAADTAAGAHLLLLLAGAVAVTATPRAPETALPRAVIVGLAVLVALPLACAVGTNNPLRMQIRVHLAPWLVLLALVAGALRVRLSAASATALVAGSALLAAAQFALHVERWPYRTTRLGSQERSVPDLPRARGLTFEPGVAQFLSELRALLDRAGHRPGGALLVFHDLPGLVWLMQGVSPGEAWYYSANPARTCAVLAHSRLPLSGARVITDGDIHASVLAALAQKGVRFPEDFRPVGALTMPATWGSAHPITVWSPVR